MRTIRYIKKMLVYMEFSFHEQGVQYLRCMLYMLIYTISSMLYPGILSLIIDKGISVKSIKYTSIYTLYFFLTGLSIIIFQYLQRVRFFEFSQKLVFQLKNKIIKKVLKANLEFWKEHNIGDTYTVIENDIPNLEVLMTTLISDIVVNILVLIGTMSILIYIDPIIGIMLLSLALVTAFIQKNFGKIVRNQMVNLRQHMGEQASFTNEILNHGINIQVTNSSEKIIHKYVSKNVSILEERVKQNFVMALSKNIGMLYNVSSILSVIIIGSTKVYNGSATIGIFFSLILYAQNLYSPIVGIGNTYITMKKIIPLVDKIVEVLENDKVVKGGELIPQKPLYGNISFKHVFYRYQKDCDFQISDLSFNLKSGEIMGIVGNNGCGKSTIVKLISQIIVPEKGTIQIDSIPIEEYDLKYLRGQIGFLLQDIFLESGNLGDIIKTDDEKQLEKIIQDFGLDKIILEQGLEHNVKENSINISGGEKQRIALANLFMEDKLIYILDEPTAAMDLLGEERICKVLKQYLENKTAIIITHRPEILKICNKVLEL